MLVDDTGRPSRESVEDVVDIRKCLGISGICDTRVAGLGSAKGFTGSSNGFAGFGARSAAQSALFWRDCPKAVLSKAIDGTDVVGRSTSKTVVGRSTSKTYDDVLESGAELVSSAAKSSSVKLGAGFLCTWNCEEPVETWVIDGASTMIEGAAEEGAAFTIEKTGVPSRGIACSTSLKGESGRELR